MCEPETVQHAGVLLPVYIHPIKAFKRFPATPARHWSLLLLKALISLSEAKHTQSSWETVLFFKSNVMFRNSWGTKMFCKLHDEL